MSEKLSYCAKIVRAHDPDRFLLAMLMPAAVQDDLLTLFAFNHEIAKTRDVVSETMLGQIRLKWWQEAIADIYDKGCVLEHEVLQALADVIERRGLSYSYFETMIYAREFDLEDVLPANLEGLAKYCDFTLTPLMRLVLQIMGEDPQQSLVGYDQEQHEDGGDAASFVSLNFALIGLLRAIPFHARTRQCFMPQDLMQKYGQSVNDLYDLKPSDLLPDLVRDVSARYRKYLRPRNKFLKATQILTRIHYKQLRRAQFDVFSKRMAIEPYFKVLRLSAAYMF